MLLALAGALMADGHFGDGHEALLDALAIVPGESIALRANLTVACARVEHLLGEYESANARLVNALDALPEPVSPEAVGIMKAVNAATLEYTKNRKQFGQPIAKFQVLQHRMADMFLNAEQATSMSYLAAIKCVDVKP